jgi:hypothetical protein
MLYSFSTIQKQFKLGGAIVNEYEEEKERVLAEEAMSEGEYMSEALHQYASAHGAERPQCAWILSPFDTWERNPYYNGPEVAHPEDSCWDYVDEEDI